jgi:glyoxalase family protein
MGRTSSEAEKPMPACQRFLAQFRVTLAILLLVATVISAGLWAYERDSALPYEGIAIFAIVLLNGFLGYLQSSPGGSGALQFFRGRRIDRREMNTETTGIHHVTAIAGEPQRNVDFYVGLLGLRMVKKTVNFDEPGTYHLYYGDGAGTPGSILTFFPWPGTPRGRIGAGQLAVTSFSIPATSLGYWTERLVEAGVRFEKPEDRFGETVLRFPDLDGLRLELVAAGKDDREGWAGGPVPAEQAVRGLHHVTLVVANPSRTTKLMTEALGFRQTGETEGRTRYEAGEGGPGNTVDVADGMGFPRGTMGVGTVHHVAFRVRDEETQLELREEVAALGYNVTAVLDRNYFRSIYFREPGGVLFEIATDPPGFAVDEEPEHLGETLKLPPWLEPQRDRLEEALPLLRVPVVGSR